MTKAFISYSHQDEEYCRQLEKHLSVLKRNGHIDTWTDRKIIAGEEWRAAISNELIEAKLIFLLISPDFLSSDFCYDIEMKSAIVRHRKNEARVIPIFLRHCDWSNTPFAELQGLPKDGKPINDWQDKDKAFLNVVEGIKTALSILSTPNHLNDNIELVKSLQQHLSEIRSRSIMAIDDYELRKILFELKTLKEEYPQSFEVENLIAKVMKSIQFHDRDGRHSTPTMNKMERSSSSYLGCAITIIIAFVTLLLLYFIYK